MYSRNFHVDFFQVEMPDAGGEFGDLLDATMSDKKAHSRYTVVRGSPTRLHFMASTKNLFEGDMVRLRMDTGAIVGKLTVEDLDPVAMEDDEGLAELTAFLFHEPTRTLAVQRNRVGVSASSILFYFEQKSDIRPIIAAPVIKEDALKRLADVGVIRKFRLRTSGTSNAALLKDSGLTGQQTLALMEEFAAPNVDIEISMGHYNGSLAKNRVIAAVKKLSRALRETQSPVTKLVVTGKTGDDEKTVLDLIEDRLVGTADVISEQRTASYQRRREALKDTWMAHRDELYRLFPPRA